MGDLEEVHQFELGAEDRARLGALVLFELPVLVFVAFDTVAVALPKLLRA